MLQKRIFLVFRATAAALAGFESPQRDVALIFSACALKSSVVPVARILWLLATLAVIIVGIAWMFGYLDLRKAAYVVLGVAITFGASEVVSTLTGGR